MVLHLSLCQKSVLCDGERVKKNKEIHQLWNLTGIGIEQRGLFTKHPMVRSEGKKYRAVWRVPACLLLCYQSWIDFIFSQCPCSYYYLCYAAIQPPIDGNGASPAAVPTPLAGAKSGDF